MKSDRTAGSTRSVDEQRAGPLCLRRYFRLDGEDLAAVRKSVLLALMRVALADAAPLLYYAVFH
ncbi:hypothetical protein KCP75_20645 [Salmonella enterica subsp. enterica]|nr:hypothetical protein KCP75_20645 [Salmonella enterica subsp. enterica]